MFWSCNAVRHQKQHPFRNKRNSFRSPSSSVHCKYQYTYNSVKVRIDRHVKQFTVFALQCRSNVGHITDVIADVCHVVDAQIENNRNRFASFGFVDFVYKLSISCALKPAKSLSTLLYFIPMAGFDIFAELISFSIVRLNTVA